MVDFDSKAGVQYGAMGAGLGGAIGAPTVVGAPIGAAIGGGLGLLYGGLFGGPDKPPDPGKPIAPGQDMFSQFRNQTVLPVQGLAAAVPGTALPPSAAPPPAAPAAAPVPTIGPPPTPVTALTAPNLDLGQQRYRSAAEAAEAREAPTQGPSAAQAQLQMGYDQAVRAAQASAATTRGDVNPALAARGLADTQANLLQTTNQQAAVLRANETVAANQQALQQRALNDQMVQMYTSAGLSSDQAQLRAAMDLQQMNQQGQEFGLGQALDYQRMNLQNQQFGVNNQTQLTGIESNAALAAANLAQQGYQFGVNQNNQVLAATLNGAGTAVGYLAANSGNGGISPDAAYMANNSIDATTGIVPGTFTEGVA